MSPAATKKLTSTLMKAQPRLEEGANWKVETAGHRMTRKVPTVFDDQKIGDIQSLVFHCINIFRSIDYVYVLDRHNHFVGVMSIKDLYSADKKSRVRDVARTSSLITVHPDAHQERVVYLALKHNIKAVPVVGSDRKFLGAILNDTILSILYKEAHEDLLHMAGITHPHAIHSNVIDTPLLISFWHRAPWLFIGLIGGLFSASIIGFFEHTLSQNLLLAAFIPLIVYMSDAVGTQMEACIIRDLALDRGLRFGLYLVRQLLITAIIAASFSMLIAIAIMGIYGDTWMGVIVGLSMAAAIQSSVITGLLTPYLFSRLKMDPADVSGPIATIVQDLLSVTIYFTAATLLL